MGLLFAGCAGKAVSRAVPRYPNSETPEARVAFNNAFDPYMAGNFAEADASFGRFISEFPYTELTDKARFYRGEIAFSRGDYNASILFYRASYGQIASPNVAPLARFKEGLALHRLGRDGEALAAISSIDRRDASAILRLRIDSLGALASKALGIAPNDGILWSLRLLDDYAEGAGAKASDVAAGDIVSEADAAAEARRFVEDETVGLAEVKALPSDEMKGRRSGGYLDYKHAYILHRMGDTDGATRILKSYVSGYPKHEYYSAARALMTELGGVIGEKAGVVVGAILPLSGRYAVYGDSVLHGAECAMGIYTPCVGPSGMKLVVLDSARPGANLSQLVDQLAAEEVVAIIGPLLSKNIMQAAARAEQLGIPMISLSQMEGVAKTGNYIFRNSVSTLSEITTLVDYVFSRKNLRRFFILYPNNRKGEEYRFLFKDAVARWGGKVVGEFAYAPNQMEFSSELRGRGMAEQVAGLAAETSRYDAIFIPDSFRVVGYIVPTLALMGVGKTQLLGISRWDDPALVERGGEYVENAIFVDSFYKNAKDSWVFGFVSKFKEAYEIEPTLLEAMGYDTMRMIIAAVQQKGAVRRDSVRDALSRTVNFPGVAGRISFDQNGDAGRGFYVLTVKDGVIQQAE